VALLCNAYWIDTDSTQGCDLPKIKKTISWNSIPDTALFRIEHNKT
jgi:hypothetical protein